MAKKEDPELIARYADMLSAMGTEPRLRIVRLLLSAHPEGMVVGEVGEELGIPSSTLSHHLEKLKNGNYNFPRAISAPHAYLTKKGTHWRPNQGHQREWCCSISKCVKWRERERE